MCAGKFIFFRILIGLCACFILISVYDMSNVDCCHICNLVDLSEGISTQWEKAGKRTRSKSRSNLVESSKINTEWICCKNWFHPFCCGLDREDFTKLNKKSNKTKTGKSDVFFKCIICCLKSFNLGETIGSYTKVVREKACKDTFKESGSSSKVESITQITDCGVENQVRVY